MYPSNKTLGEQCHDALLAAAEKKNAALTTERMSKRIFAECFIRADGKNIEERKAVAGMSEAYSNAEDRRIEAESAHNLAKAESDGLQIRFSEWQTMESTRRAEMTLR